MTTLTREQHTSTRPSDKWLEKAGISSLPEGVSVTFNDETKAGGRFYIYSTHGEYTEQNPAIFETKSRVLGNEVLEGVREILVKEFGAKSTGKPVEPVSSASFEVAIVNPA